MNVGREGDRPISAAAGGPGPFFATFTIVKVNKDRSSSGGGPALPLFHGCVVCILILIVCGELP
jgi:hypothetical protein